MSSLSARRPYTGTSGYVLSLVCLVSARGLLHRSKPSIEITNVTGDTPECKAAQSGSQARWPAHPTGSQGGGYPRQARLPGRYPSLRAKRRTTPLLRVPDTADSSADWRNVLARLAVGQMRSCTLRRVVDAIPAKGLQTGNCVEVTHLERMPSSGGLLRSSCGIARSCLSSIQRGGSSRGSRSGRASGLGRTSSARLPVGESTSQAGTGPATGSRRWDGQGIDVARPECDRPVGFVRVIGNVAKRKPASTVSGEQSDRQLSAGASRQTGP